MKADASNDVAAESTASKPTMVRIRPETREKIEAIASAKSWTFTETYDQAADALAAREGIKFPVNQTA